MLMSDSPWQVLDDRALRECIDQGLSKTKMGEFLCRDIGEIERRMAELGLEERGRPRQPPLRLRSLS
jgi:hypothetical protein